MIALTAAVQDPLNCPLRKGQSTPTFLRAVVRELWDQEILLREYQQNPKFYGSYITHIYRDILVAACRSDFQTPECSHRHIFDLVKRLKCQRWTKLEATGYLQTLSSCSDAAYLERCVDIAAGLLVPLNFQGVGGARRGEIVRWEDNMCLSETVSNWMAVNSSGVLQNQCTSCSSSWRFCRKFNAYQVTHISGFEIVWTSNLADHLLVQDDDDKVKLHIFHQVKVLENHLAFQSTILSRNLILETMDTLALLVPRTDPKVRRWYKALQKLHTLDPGVLSLEYLSLENRDINHFKCWGGRLRKLKQAFDDHEPNGPLQWWRDDRKSVQWWTFWVAALVLILTIVFGFTQSVASIMQVLRL
ncbi:hypothetical protein BKA65DRAFT_69054 [Rhexocercosporidium sp. MPI-PUGE-AT-0058]|nr:hypothetical protein BKA65DRAFT_69054 [Rhexocercosporidium sp. MPI-PUGE-AT-0058]